MKQSINKGEVMNTYLIDILRILEEHSDENNKLSQQEIHRLMQRKDTNIDRKAIKRNLDKLIELDYYDINYKESTRTNKNGKETSVFTEWYMNKDFTDAELHLLIDGLLFSKYIPYNLCKKIVKKLKKQASKSFRQKSILPEDDPENKELLFTIEIINDAIKAGKRVSFHFSAYGTDKKKHIILDADGKPHIYRVSPYEIVAANGRYYLLCSNNEGGLFNYRLDYIRNAGIIENQNIRPIREIKGYEHGMDLAKYMKEHIYMYGGESKRVSFRADKSIVGQIIDWFGTDVAFTKIEEDSVEAYVTVNENAMLYWALQYGESVEIITPETLRNSVREAVKKMWERYSRET